MKNALTFALSCLSLIAPLVTWAAEPLNEVPAYDPYQTYTLWVTYDSTPYVGLIDEREVHEFVVAQIPEPGSIILVLTGLGLLAYSTSRRKRS